MKIFAVAIISAFLANYGASAASCSSDKPCAKNMKCMMNDAKTAGKCVYDTVHQGIDYNRANQAFTAADIDHNRKITFGGAYQALHTLEPAASEKMLDKLTKNGDQNKNGYIDYSEFIAMYKVLEDKVDHSGSANDKCAANPCNDGQMCRNCKNTKGYCCETIATVPAVTTAPTGQLTADERAQVNNIYTALNTNKDKGVSHQEFNQMLMAVRETMGQNTKLYGEVYHYVMVQGDTNNDKIIEYSEFIQACTTLKAKDPKSFPQFLAAAEKLKPLVLGDPCVKYGANRKACPSGSSCQRQRVQVPYGQGSGSSRRTYTAYRYFCAAATTTKKPVPSINNVKAGQKCSYGSCQSGCLKCASGLTCRRMAYQYGDVQTNAPSGVCTPKNCKDCVNAKGTWMGNQCQFGSPNVADGPMFTTAKQCAHYDAAKNAKCSTHHDCKSCATMGMDKTLGALCGWSSGWSGHGSCQPNYGSSMSPLTTAASKCTKTVIVNGRE